MSAEETLSKLITTITKEQNYNDCEVIIKEISSGGANYSSRLFTATVKENGKENLNLFAKVACISKEMRDSAEFTEKLYINEQFMYIDVANIFKSLEDESGIIGDDRLTFSKFYGRDSTTYLETIVLEDLTATGWESFDRFKSIDWPYASTVFTELAKLHALYFAYKEKNPVEYNRLLERFEISFGDMFDVVSQNGLTTALKYIPSKYQQSLQNHMKEYSMSSPKFLVGADTTTIIHGDFRPSNLMHRVNQDGTVDIKILDLQSMHGNSPVVDVIYFIFSGSDGEFREKYLKKLLDHYYTQLEASMKRLNLETEKIYSRTQYEQELKEKLPFGLTLSVLGLPMLTVAPENAPKSDDILNVPINNESQLYQDRLNEVINDFVKWGILKETKL